MGVETLMAKEAAGVLVRRPDKFKHTLGQYLLSFYDCEVSRTGRAAYFFIRYIDDLLDGDRKLPRGENPLIHISSIRFQVETGNFTGEPEIVKLAKYSLDALTKKARSGDNPKRDFLDLIDIMVFDCHRRQKRQILTGGQLEEYYQKTFSPIHNLMLVALQSKLRAVDIPEFSLCQGRVYTIEHLKPDWQVGIVNIPVDILGLANLNNDSPYENVIQSRTIRGWGLRELQESKAKLLSLQTKFPSSERITCKIYETLTASMLKFIDKYCQKTSLQ